MHYETKLKNDKEEIFVGTYPEPQLAYRAGVDREDYKNGNYSIYIKQVTDRETTDKSIFNAENNKDN